MDGRVYRVGMLRRSVAINAESNSWTDKSRNATCLQESGIRCRLLVRKTGFEPSIARIAPRKYKIWFNPRRARQN